ncbi:hypothetical protein ALC62_05527 [Cyphomyrmex costatus]|uniref:Uncharacterized protein n=1 Tax=Cyphomyrmex costatus TaxID=456900 RepID=A0A195CSI0_9HYME|nr:hypothetical protein ALC62_05527 [Cyphomyrmex costatus]
MVYAKRASLLFLFLEQWTSTLPLQHPSPCHPPFTPPVQSCRDAPTPQSLPLPPGVQPATRTVASRNFTLANGERAREWSRANVSIRTHRVSRGTALSGSYWFDLTVERKRTADKSSQLSNRKEGKRRKARWERRRERLWSSGERKMGRKGGDGVDRRETERASAGRMVREAEGEHAGVSEGDIPGTRRRRARVEKRVRAAHYARDTSRSSARDRGRGRVPRDEARQETHREERQEERERKIIERRGQRNPWKSRGECFVGRHRPPRSSARAAVDVFCEGKPPSCEKRESGERGRNEVGNARRVREDRREIGPGRERRARVVTRDSATRRRRKQPVRPTYRGLYHCAQLSSDCPRSSQPRRSSYAPRWSDARCASRFSLCVPVSPCLVSPLVPSPGRRIVSRSRLSYM